MYTDLKSVLKAILKATTNKDIEAILAGIGDNKEVGLDEAFGMFDLKWHAFGDNLSNISTIGLAKMPGRSVTERLTNAMDALIEERALGAIEKPDSPRMAIYFPQSSPLRC